MVGSFFFLEGKWLGVIRLAWWLGWES